MTDPNTRYHLPVTAEQFHTDPSAKIPEGLIAVMIGRSGSTIMEHGHSDNPNYTRGYAFRVGDQYGGEWHLPDDGDWVVTNSRGQRVLVSDADFKALYKDGP